MEQFFGWELTFVGHLSCTLEGDKGEVVGVFKVYRSTVNKHFKLEKEIASYGR